MFRDAEEWVDAAWNDFRNPMVTYQEDATIRLPMALKALEKVLYLHSSISPIADTRGFKYCVSCGPKYLYPCPTIREINAMLLKEGS